MNENIVRDVLDRLNEVDREIADDKSLPWWVRQHAKRSLRERQSWS